MDKTLAFFTIEELKRAVDIIDGFSFIYGEHQYLIFRHADMSVSICEICDNMDDTKGNFLTVDDLLDNYLVYDGKKIIDVITESKIDFEYCLSDINYVIQVIKGEIPKDKVQIGLCWW